MTKVCENVPRIIIHIMFIFKWDIQFLNIALTNTVWGEHFCSEIILEYDHFMSTNEINLICLLISEYFKIILP